MKTDRFLIGIVIGVLVLVVASVALVLTRPEAEYLSDDAPENVVHNYILAVLQEDYDRAFGYLSPDIAHGPEDAADLEHDLSYYNYRWDQDASYVIDSARVSGSSATVIVSALGFYSDDIFFGRGQYTDERTFRLGLENGKWRIVEGSIFFPYCWTYKDGCP
ncbi:MAG: hypothetical protein HYZ26_14385 [Chloroflexi bacterium]|nr:hypothetical protein [Chloroflexota bacterium]